MKIKLLSDIHMEFWKNHTPKWYNTPNDILILGGDIHVGPTKLKLALEHFASISNHVIYVPGNHEYYGYNLGSYDDLKLPSNVHWLNPGTVRIGDITFIGATMWTDFRNDPIHEQIAEHCVNDFNRIKNFSTTKCKELFEEHTAYIRRQIKELTGPKIIITHFIPGQHGTHPRWRNKGYPTDQLNSYFAPEPRITLDPSVTHWLFGHTHDSIDVTLGAVRYIANPYGYHYNYEINPNFNPELIL